MIMKTIISYSSMLDRTWEKERGNDMQQETLGTWYRSHLVERKSQLLLVSERKLHKYDGSLPCMILHIKVYQCCCLLRVNESQESRLFLAWQKDSSVELKLIMSKCGSSQQHLWQNSVEAVTAYYSSLSHPLIRKKRPTINLDNGSVGVRSHPMNSYFWKKNVIHPLLPTHIPRAQTWLTHMWCGRHHQQEFRKTCTRARKHFCSWLELTKVRFLRRAFDAHALRGWFNEVVSDKICTALFCFDKRTNVKGKVRLTYSQWS